MPEELNLSGANEGALADIQAANAAGSAPVEEAPAPAVEEAAPLAASPEATDTPAPEAQATSATEEVVDKPAAQEWTFTRKGQEVKITDPQQAADLIRQGYDYTQKTMELGEARRAMEAQVRQILTNRELLRQQLAHLEAQQGPVVTRPAAPDPDDVPTVQQTQQLVQAQLAQAQAQSQAYIQNAILQAETARYTEEYKGSVQASMAEALAKFPTLKDIDKIEKLILDDVGEMVQNRVALEPDQVVDIKDVKRMIVEVAQRRDTKLQARVKEHLKMEQVRAAKAGKAAIEPAGGAPAAPSATAEKLNLNDPRLTALAIADLQAAFSRK